MKRGQIAHLDHDSSNSSVGNLAFLCLDHHDLLDSSTRQSKNLSLTEVKQYRDELYQQIIPLIESHLPDQAPSHPPADNDASFRANEERVATDAIVEALERGPATSVESLARQVRLMRSAVERLLHDLTQSGVVRVDRKSGTTQRTYSLANSIENRLLDSFIASLDKKVTRDARHLRHRNGELDAAVTTEDGITYAIETALARVDLSRESLLARLDRLVEAKVALRLSNARDVLVIGVTGKTRRPEATFSDLEARGVLLRYVDLTEQGDAA